MDNQVRPAISDGREMYATKGDSNMRVEVTKKPRDGYNSCVTVKIYYGVWQIDLPVEKKQSVFILYEAYSYCMMMKVPEAHLEAESYMRRELRHRRWRRKKKAEEGMSCDISIRSHYFMGS